MSEPLFVYGSLVFPEVREAVLGRAAASAPAAVEGWRVAALRDRDFPGLVRSEGSRVTGLVLTDLTGPERARVHAYEGTMYRQELIPLVADAGGSDDAAAPTHGWTYVCVEESLVLGTDWDRQNFADMRLSDYLAHCRRWAASR